MLALSQILALAALFYATAYALTLLHETVHALGHVDHVLSLPAQVLDDGTRVPLIVGLYLTATVAILLLSEPLASGSPANRVLLKVFPLGMTACLGIFLVVGISLRAADLQHIPWSADLPNPFLVVNTVSLVLSAAGALLLLLYLCRPHLLWLYACTAVPSCGAILLTLLLPAERIVRQFRLDNGVLPSAYPRVLWVSLAVVVLLLAGAVLQRLWSRIGAEKHDLHIGALVAGMWAWALFFLVSPAALLPYHHMCFIFRHAPIQEKVGRLITLAFLGFWTIVAVVQSSKRWQRRSARRQAMLVKNSTD